MHPGTASQVFHHLVADLDREQAACLRGIPSRSGACCAGIAKAVAQERDDPFAEPAWLQAAP